MKILNGRMLAGLAAFAAQVATASPTVTSVAMTQQRGGGPVTITYTLTDAPAVVTLDVQTNYTENAVEKWASIGGEHICNASGDVWRKVGSSGAFNGTITWRPDMSWKDEDGNGFKIDGTTQKARAVVTAWRLDNTPDYMVVDISAGAQLNSQRYYPSVDFLPGSELGQTGAITNNPIYKTSMLVMRKIMAKDVTWTMGSTSVEYKDSDTAGYANETPHQVTLTNNYYIGVFEITGKQWTHIMGAQHYSRYSSADAISLDKDYRPQDQLCYNELRHGSGDANNSSFYWPNPAHEDSLIGRLCSRTGLDFELPSEAEWEFACRAGHGDGCWNDGSAMAANLSSADANLSRLARYNGTRTGSPGSTDSFTATSTPIDVAAATGGTAIVGTYEPNSWGLYDMQGNVYEWCLDWYVQGITGNCGMVNVKMDAPAEPLAGEIAKVNSQVTRVLRGGGETGGATFCRPARRYYRSQATRYAQYARGDFGVRVVCRAGLD